MSHNKFPSTFKEQQDLGIAVNKKHLADGTKSVLTPYLATKKIVLADDIADGVLAAGHELSRVLFTGQSEQARIDRDTVFDPIWVRTKLWAQFLKVGLGGNVKLLTDWGITIDVNGRIKYSSSFELRAILCNKIIDKHLGYAIGTSPLLPFITTNGDDIPALKIATGVALASNDSSVQLRVKSFIETAARNKIWDTPKKNLRLIGVYLMKLFATDTSVVGEWGFNIVSLASIAKSRNIKLKPTLNRTISNVFLGSKFKNTSPFELVYYQGKKMSSTPITVKAGEEVGLNKGCSSITVVNPSTINHISFSVVTAS